MSLTSQQLFWLPRPTQPSILSGSVNEDQLWLGSKERYGSFRLRVNMGCTGKTVISLITRAIPEHVRGVCEQDLYKSSLILPLPLQHICSMFVMFVAYLKIKIPWKNLSTEQTVIELDGVYVIVVPYLSMLIIKSLSQECHCMNWLFYWANV